MGCGQLVYHKDGKLISIEGNPQSPISRGHLCPKGADTHELHTHSGRLKKVKYRAPWSGIAVVRLPQTDGVFVKAGPQSGTRAMLLNQALKILRDLEVAMDMVADYEDCVDPCWTCFCAQLEASARYR